jgi:hypothetical protein
MKNFLKSIPGIILIIFLSIIAIFCAYQFGYKNYKAKKHEAEVKKTFEPIYDQLNKGKQQATKSYDLQETVRIINGLDVAMQEKNNFNDFMLYMAHQDYSQVAPEVVEARTKLLQTLQKLYAKQTTLEEQQALWNITKEMSGIVINNIGAEDIVTHGITLPAKAVTATKQSYSKLTQLENEKKVLKNDIATIESDLFNQLIDYSGVYYKYVNEWDKVCVNRDMAYLAAHSNNLPAMNTALAKVFAQYPQDKEAQLLKAYSMVQNMKNNTAPIINPETGMSEQNQILPLLDNYMQAHPGETAPALLLKGVYFAQIGDANSAKLNFEQAAVYYPKQANELSDMLNPYKMRNYLKKSKEGSYITELYKSTMLGAGYFSPDLQMAKMYFDKGDTKNGKEKVLDHFSRRRNQSHWDYILSDIHFCEKNLGVNFLKLFPENQYLDLKADVKHSLSANADYIKVGVDNRSDVRLHNASLILCIQYTEMNRDDYVSIKMDKTLPELLPNSYNDFGEIDNKKTDFWSGTLNSTKYLLSIGNNLFESGTQKQEGIVKSRAVLISDEAIVWIDDADTKVTNEVAKDYVVKFKPEELGLDVAGIQNLIKQKLTATATESIIGSDEVKIKLPEQLAILKPVFKLVDPSTGKIYSPEVNMIKNDMIELNFKVDVEKLKDLKLVMNSISLNGSINLTGDKTKGYKFKDISLK